MLSEISKGIRAELPNNRSDRVIGLRPSIALMSLGRAAELNRFG
jgi:hypothetical protein